MRCETIYLMVLRLLLLNLCNCGMVICQKINKICCGTKYEKYQKKLQFNKWQTIRERKTEGIHNSV